MRRFLFKIFYFILLPAIILFILEISILVMKPNLLSESSLDNIFGYSYYDYQWISNLKNDSLIFLAGSSSVKCGLSCSILNRLSEQKWGYVNIARLAGDPIETYFILKHLNLSKVRKIYFGLDPWIYTKTYYEHRIKYLYLDFSFIEALKYNFQHDNRCMLKRYLFFFKYETPRKHKTNSDKIPDDFGSAAGEGVARNFNNPINKWFKIEEYGWSELQFQYLKKIEDLCKENRIYFAVFIPPKRSDYLNIYKTKCKQIHNEFIDNLNKVNFSAPIFGTFNQLDDVGDYELFVDGVHLNKNGQKKYSEIFYELTKNIKDIFNENHLWFSE